MGGFGPLSPIDRYRRAIEALRVVERARDAETRAANRRLATVYKALDDGHRATDIAAVLGVTRQTVYRLARRGSKLAAPEPADLDQVAAADRRLAAAARKLWTAAATARDAGATVADIAALTGVSKSSVRATLRQQRAVEGS